MDSVSLLLLYDSVFIPIMREWVYDVDLCSLDTAVCNHRLRPKFLSRLSQCQIVNSILSNAEIDVQWMVLKGLKFKSLVLDASYHPSLTPVLSSHLSFVTVEDVNALESFLYSGLNFDSLRIHLNSTIPSSLQSVDHLITCIDLNEAVPDEFCAELASMCPSLKSIRCCNNHYNSDAVWTFVDSCPVDTIECCNLKAMVTRQKCSQYYQADLVRVPVNDETALCFAEGKYYHVTAIRFSQNLPRVLDLEYLTPVLPNLQSLKLSPILSFSKRVVAQCHNLTSLELIRVDSIQNEVIALIQQSFLLVHLKCHHSNNGNQLCKATATGCPRLQSFALVGISVGEAYLLDVLHNCPDITYIESAELYGSVLTLLAVNLTAVEQVRASPKGRLQKRGRCHNHLQIPLSVGPNAIKKIVMHNVGLRKIDVDSCDVIDTVVQHCPYIDSVLLRNCDDWSFTCVESLAQCSRLTSLSLSMVGFADPSDYVRIFSNKPRLQHLEILHCTGYNKQLLSILAVSCLDLRMLYLKNDQLCTGVDFSDLFSQCQRLHTLKLDFCQSIGPEILPVLKISTLQKVEFWGCKVKQEDETLFRDSTSISVSFRKEPNV